LQGGRMGKGRQIFINQPLS